MGSFKETPPDELEVSSDITIENLRKEIEELRDTNAILNDERNRYLRKLKAIHYVTAPFNDTYPEGVNVDILALFNAIYAAYEVSEI